MAYAADLGPYVYLMNPYVATPLPLYVVPTGVINWATVPPVINLGPPDFFVPPPPPTLQQPVDTLYGLDLGNVEAEDYYGTWEFRGLPRKLARTLRIPYMYYKASPNLVADSSNNPIVPAGATLVCDHLLIGYEGMGGH
jgi:hypothetical protein